MNEAAAATDRFARDWPVTYVIAPAVRALALYFRARAVGVDRIPASRPVVYVGKHPRTWLYLETMLLGLFAFWDSGRPAFRVLEQKGTSLHRAPIVGWLRRHVSGIPASADAAIGALARGESVLVFPGGTRELYGPRDTLQWRGRTGFARLAARAGAPVLPFAIAGADRQHPWRLKRGRTSLWLPPFPLPVRLEFRFGSPMMPPPADATASEIAAFAAQVEDATRDLIRGTPVRPWALGPRPSWNAVRRSALGARRLRPSIERRGQARAAGPGPRAESDPPRAENGVILDATRWRYRFGYLRLAHWLSRYHRVRVEGTPCEGPCIYVTRHGAGYLSGDLVVAVYQLAWRDAFERRGPARTLRVAAAQGHAMERALPGLAWLKRHAGLVDASAESCLSVLARGEQLLITPGGRREATPRARGYRLHWHERFGFVRLALRTGVPIVPVALIGGREAYPGAAVGKLSLWAPVPLPARMTMAIGAPIAVPHRPGDAQDPAVLRPLQEEVWRATQALFDRLLAARAPRRALRGARGGDEAAGSRR